MRKGGGAIRLHCGDRHSFVSFRIAPVVLVQIYGHDYWCCKQKNIEIREVQPTVSRTSPIRLNVAYSIGRRGAETKTNVFKMAAK
jgi:hypothetical protein